jgi:hypothetical protein
LHTWNVSALSVALPWILFARRWTVLDLDIPREFLDARNALPASRRQICGRLIAVCRLQAAYWSCI